MEQTATAAATMDPLQEAKVLHGEQLLGFFTYAHLPERLQKVSRPFGALALALVELCPKNAERTVALRKLLESKDCAVRAVLAILLVLLAWAPAAAQTVVPPDTAFKVQADHDGLETVGYRVYLDGKSLGDVPKDQALVGSLVSIDVPAQLRGTHTISLAAFNTEGEARTPNLTFLVRGPMPTAPLKLRLVLIAQTSPQGQLSIQVQELALLEAPPELLVPPASPPAAPTLLGASPASLSVPQIPTLVLQ